MVGTHSQVFISPARVVNAVMPGTCRAVSPVGLKQHQGRLSRQSINQPDLKQRAPSETREPSTKNIRRGQVFVGKGMQRTRRTVCHTN